MRLNHSEWDCREHGLTNPPALAHVYIWDQAGNVEIRRGPAMTFFLNEQVGQQCLQPRYTGFGKFNNVKVLGSGIICRQPPELSHSQIAGDSIGQGSHGLGL